MNKQRLIQEPVAILDFWGPSELLTDSKQNFLFVHTSIKTVIYKK